MSEFLDATKQIFEVMAMGMALFMMMFLCAVCGWIFLQAVKGE